jgi:hypothetical protein
MNHQFSTEGNQDRPVQSSIKEANQISGVPEENHALLPYISLHPYAGETLLNNKQANTNKLAHFPKQHI